MRTRAFAIFAFLFMAAYMAAPALAAPAKPRIAIVKGTAADGLVKVAARVAGLRRAHRVQLERQVPSGKWVRARPVATRQRGKRLTLRWRPPPTLDSVTLRLRILSRDSGRVVATSEAVTVFLRPPDRGSDDAAPGPVATVPAGGSGGPEAGPPGAPPPPIEKAEFRVPPDTRLYQPADFKAVGPGDSDEEAVIEFASGSTPPVVGGHVALAPDPNLPDGMFGRVEEVIELEGTTIAQIEQASVDEVLEEVDVDFEGNVDPTLVDADGNPVASQLGDDATLRLSAAAAGTSSVSSSAFECKDAGNVARSAEELWETGLPFPVEITFQNTHAIHRFDSGSLFPPRDPFFLLQFSGEATAKAGVEPKAAFKCALSATYRRNHRLRFRVGTIGPVPVSIYLEPAFQFEVSATGDVSFNQRHYFSLTLEKDGFAAPDLRLAHSADPPTVGLGAKLEAAVFAGGDLSVMAGGGFRSANAQAGVFGAFGPEVTLSIDQDQPACVALRGRLKAELGVRFELWVKRWDFQLASLSTAPTSLADPVCAFGAPGDPTAQPVSRSGSPEPFTYTPWSTSSYLTLPAADGWWLVGEQEETGGWQYQWLDPAGNPGPTWTTADQPLSFARGADGAIVAASQTPEGDLRLTRFGEEGPESERVEQTSPYAPFVQRLAGEVGGNIYLFARLASSPERPSTGTFRLDPLTLNTTGYAPMSADNPGIVAHQAGVTTIDYYGGAQLAPYGSFGVQPPAEPVIEMPVTHSAAYTQFSVGEGGDIADVDTTSRDCAALTTSVRHPDGTAWTRPLAELVAESVPTCELADVDALPDGGAAYTLRGDDGTYILTAGSAGDRLSLTRIGPFGLNPTTVVDASGIVVTAFTERFDCAEAGETFDKCSQVVLVGEKDGAVVWTQPLHSDRQTMMPFTWFGGRPSITIGKDQIGVQLLEVDPNSCGSDNCTPYSATSSFQTIVKPLQIGNRPSFVWW